MPPTHGHPVPRVPNENRPSTHREAAVEIPAAVMLTVLIAALAHPPTSQAQPHWPQFRGPNGQGVSETAQPPLTFSAGPTTATDAGGNSISGSNLLWSTPAGPGVSSPVLWGDHLFLTSCPTGQLVVTAFHRKTGRLEWSWSVPAGPTGDVHTASSPAAPSCAADAERVYAYFGSWGLTGISHDGREAWRVPMPPPRNRYGMATSPVLHGGHVILVLDADDTHSRIAAFRTADGTPAWETERPGQRATWSTPALWPPPGTGTGTGSNPNPPELIVLSALRLSSYDPRDGRELWSLDGFPQETVSVPAIGPDLVFAGAAALGGRGDERYDAMGWKQLLRFDLNADQQIQTNEVPDDFRMVLRPDLPPTHPGYAVPFPFKRDFRNKDLNRDGSLSEAEWNESVLRWEASSRPVLMAVHPGPSTNAPPARVQWKTARGLPEMPSFLLYRSKLFYVRDGGLLSCLEAATGRFLYQERVGAPGQYCASPIAAANRLYLASVDGLITVVDATTPELSVLARNRIAGSITATPALAGESLYVRTSTHLLAFGNTSPSP